MEQFKNDYAIQVAAGNGNPDAQYLYGLECLKKGKTIKAFDNLSSSASKGQALAMVEMGKLSLSDFGGHNVEKAKKWFQSAEESGDIEAILQLGIIFYSGDKINFDIVRAKSLFLQAKIAGKSEADYYLKFLVENEQLLIDACRDNANAQYEIGNLYLDKRYEYSVKEMISIGIRWITLSANNHHIDAIIQLGEFYQEGKYVSRDLTAAKTWLEQAVSRGRFDSISKLDKINNLEVIYLEGSYGTIYDGSLFYDIVNESTARRLNCKCSSIKLEDIQMIKYQKNRFNFTVLTKDKETLFKLKEPQDRKITTHGDSVVSLLCSLCGLSHLGTENDSVLIKIGYGVLAFAISCVNSVLESDIPSPGTPIIDVYSNNYK